MERIIKDEVVPPGDRGERTVRFIQLLVGIDYCDSGKNMAVCQLAGGGGNGGGGGGGHTLKLGRHTVLMLAKFETLLVRTP